MSSLDYRALSRIHAESALKFQPGLFAKYWQAVDRDVPLRILDLGPVHSSSIDFYSQSEVPCFITIADCLDELSDFCGKEAPEPDEMQLLLDKLIPDAEQPYDVVLLWEYPNYIQPWITACLQRKINRITHKNSILYAYLYTSNTGSGYPGNFRIKTENSFVCDEKTDTKPVIINSLRLKKYFQDFQSFRSVLIRNGLQEIIMRRNH